MKFSSLKEKKEKSIELYNKLKEFESNNKEKTADIFKQYKFIFEINGVDEEMNFNYLKFIFSNYDFVQAKIKKIDKLICKLIQTLNQNNLKQLNTIIKSSEKEFKKNFTYYQELKIFKGDLNDLKNILINIEEKGINTIRDFEFFLEENYGLPIGYVNNKNICLRYMIEEISRKIYFLIQRKDGEEIFNKKNNKNIPQKEEINRIYSILEKNNLNEDQKDEILKVFENRVKREDEKKNAQLFYKMINNLKKSNNRIIKDNFFQIKRGNNKFINRKFKNLFLNAYHLYNNKNEIDFEKFIQINENNEIEIFQKFKTQKNFNFNDYRDFFFFIFADEKEIISEQKFKDPIKIILKVFQEFKYSINGINTIDEFKFFVFLFTTIIFAPKISLYLDSNNNFNYIKKLSNILYKNNENDINNLIKHLDFKVYIKKESKEKQYYIEKYFESFKDNEFSIINILEEISKEKYNISIIKNNNLLFNHYLENNILSPYIEEIKNYIKSFISSHLMKKLYYLNDDFSKSGCPFPYENNDNIKDIISMIKFYPFPEDDISGLTERNFFEIYISTYTSKLINFDCDFNEDLGNNWIFILFNISKKIIDIEHEIIHSTRTLIKYLGFDINIPTDRDKILYQAQDLTFTASELFNKKYTYNNQSINKFNFIDEEKELNLIKKKRKREKKKINKETIKKLIKMKSKEKIKSKVKNNQIGSDGGKKFECQLYTNGDNIGEININQIFYILDEDFLNEDPDKYHSNFIELKDKNYQIQIQNYKANTFLGKLISLFNITQEEINNVYKKNILIDACRSSKNDILININRSDVYDVIN